MKRQIEIIMVDDSEMRRMNRQFRHKNKTTDVLTFVYPDLVVSASRLQPLRRPPGFAESPGSVVEIYISLPVAKKQARDRKITLHQECLRLVVHGLCHAAGMDHHTLAEFAEMRRCEFEVLVQCAID